MKAMQYGQLVIALVTQIPANAITKSQGQSLTVRVNYTWQGPAKTLTGYVAVTHQYLLDQFSVIGSTQIDFATGLPQSPTSPVSGYFIVPGLPLSGCEVGSGYGVKVHIDNFAEWGVLNCLTIQAENQQLGISSLVLS